jgi:hypothetical protein
MSSRAKVGYCVVSSGVGHAQQTTDRQGRRHDASHLDSSPDVPATLSSAECHTSYTSTGPTQGLRIPRCRRRRTGSMLAANAIGRSRDRLAPLARGNLDFSKAAWSCSVLDSNSSIIPRKIVRKRSLTKWEVHSGLGAGGHDLHRDGAAFGDATPRVAQPRTFFETLAFGQTKTVEAKGERRDRG